jgi:transposase
MIQISPNTKIFAAIAPIDFRKGLDALKALCKQQFFVDPFCGSLFIFRNRAATSIRLLQYDGQGFWLCLKKMSQGRFHWWPKDEGEALTQLAAKELHILLYSGNPKTAQLADDWKRLP